MYNILYLLYFLILLLSLLGNYDILFYYYSLIPLVLFIVSIKHKYLFLKSILVILTIFFLLINLYEINTSIKLSIFFTLIITAAWGKKNTYPVKQSLLTIPLILIPILEILLKSNNLHFGFAREIDTEDLIFSSNTMEVPLIMTLLGVYYIDKGNNYKLKTFGILMLLINLFIFNRRFVIISLFFCLLFYLRPKITKIFIKIYSLLLPAIWVFLVSILNYFLNNYPILSSILTKDEGVGNIEGASGRLLGWFGSFNKLINERPWFSQTLDLPAEWFLNSNDRHQHVHNTLLQAGLDFGLIICFLLVIFLIYKKNLNYYIIIIMSLIPTESLFSNFNLVSIICIYILFNHEKSKNTNSTFII